MLGKLLGQNLTVPFTLSCDPRWLMVAILGSCDFDFWMVTFGDTGLLLGTII